jgi:hypothetical protein
LAFYLIFFYLHPRSFLVSFLTSKHIGYSNLTPSLIFSLKLAKPNVPN